MPDPSRHTLIQQLDDLCEQLLPAAAKTNPKQYPVRFGHCFRRIAYDMAMGGRKWTDHVERPFIDNAPTERLDRAVQYARHMLTNPEHIKALNEDSIRARKPDMSDAERWARAFQQHQQPDAQRRARIALDELDTHGRDTRTYDNQFETGDPVKNAATVAALWHLYRTDSRARWILNRYKRYAPPAVFNDNLKQERTQQPSLF